MRISGALVGWVIAQVASCVFSVGVANAQSDTATQPAFLGFGIPCENPLPEADTSKPNGPQTPPRSNPARPLSAPEYPTVSRRLGEEGVAVVRLLVAESGQVSQAEIAQSTGSSRLDEAALEVTRNWHLQPGKLNGEPRCMWGKFGVTFKLTDYADAELSVVSVGPEARELADRLMEMEQLKEIWLRKDDPATPAERQIVDLALDAAGRSTEWVTAKDQVARILAFEFSAAELSELNGFFASPVAAKWTSLNFKMMPTIMAHQRLVAQTLLCSIQGVDQAMEAKDMSEVVVDGRIVDRYQQAIPRFVESAIPYCTCMFRKSDRNGGLTGLQDGVKNDCGAPPQLGE